MVCAGRAVAIYIWEQSIGPCSPSSGALKLEFHLSDKQLGALTGMAYSVT